jgi:hypothetical protein
VKVGEKTPTQLGPLERANLNTLLAGTDSFSRQFYVISMLFNIVSMLGELMVIQRAGRHALIRG